MPTSRRFLHFRCFFFFNDTATTEIYTLSLHDALPISDRVNKLLLYAPQWIRTTPSLIATSGPLGAYRVVQEDAAKARWLTGVPETKKAELIPPGWFDAWAAATFSSDPWGVKQSPKKLRAPNGTQQDTREYWSAGKAYYEPETIRVPTLLLVGEWDQDTPPYMAQALFPKLVNAPYKQLVQIGEATHTVLMEKRSEEHTSELQSRLHLVCRLLLEKKKNKNTH